MNKKQTLLVSSLLLATTVSQAQKVKIEVRTLTPNDTNIEDITYNRSIELIAKERLVKYGEPIGVFINKEEGFADIFNIDDIVIRVSIDELLSQPNRTGPTKEE